MDGQTACRRCYLYGAGGHSNVVEDALRASGYELVGRIDDNPKHVSPILPGIRLTGFDYIPKVNDPIVIAIGSNEDRAYVSRHLKADFISVFHPSAIISPSSFVFVGAVILHGAIIQSNSSIGSFVIVNTAASVGHDSKIGDFAHISPGVRLCGQVGVGEGAHVGAGAIVIPGITIGRWSIVGAGSVVIRDVPDFCTVVGNPARAIKKREPPSELNR
jgi:sugar O-acyltransferase (sialic acid O-acetyltransferase NeuD family)